MSDKIRITTLAINEVLPFIFTREVRHNLKKAGISYQSEEWKRVSHHDFLVDGKVFNTSVGSHRYQLFAEKGTKCAICGIYGEYFALERGDKDNKLSFHLNLYGRDNNGNEVMLTKDHIIPRSLGGPNRLTNYQVLCNKCNQKKANRRIHSGKD